MSNDSTRLNQILNSLADSGVLKQTINDALASNTDPTTKTNALNLIGDVGGAIIKLVNWPNVIKDPTTIPNVQSQFGTEQLQELKNSGNPAVVNAIGFLTPLGAQVSGAIIPKNNVSAVGIENSGSGAAKRSTDSHVPSFAK